MRKADFLEIVSALNAAQARYLIVGGLAVVEHGHLRYTKDVDIVLSLERENAMRGLEALGAIGYKPKIPVSFSDFANNAMRESWVREKNMVVFQLWSDRFRETPVDIFVEEPFDFDLEFELALRSELSTGLVANFVRLEALITMKEKAGRGRDLDDVEQLKIAQRIREKNNE